MEKYDLADPLPGLCAPGRSALEVAASERQHLLFVAPPGAGVTMLARRLPGILPELSESSRASVVEVYRRAGVKVPEGRPFRAPHYSASPQAVLGCERRAGEVELARHGVLFLDGVLQFRPEVLREVFAAPEVSNGTVLVVGHEYPSECGYMPGTPDCKCSAASQASWPAKLARLLGYFPAAITLPRLPRFSAPVSGECSATVRGRVSQAWEARGWAS